jgi:hypothetical protein
MDVIEDMAHVSHIGPEVGNVAASNRHTRRSGVIVDNPGSTFAMSLSTRRSRVPQS